MTKPGPHFLYCRMDGNKMIKKDFNAVYRSINNISLRQFPAETLQKMYDNYSVNQQKLFDEIKKIKKTQKEKLDTHDGLEVENLRKKSKGLQSQFNEIEDEKSRIWKALQECILNERLISKFGSPWLVNLKEAFIMILIVFVLSLLFYDLTHPELSLEIKRLFFFVDTGCCIIFLVNFFYELRLADSKKWYWKSHLIDFVTSIPFPADLRIFRAGRALRVARLVRLARLARLLRVFRFILFFWKGMDQLSEVLDIKLMKKSFFYTIIVLISGGVIIYFLESDGGMGVSNVSESIWWSFTTLVTGGFADIHNPITGAGRILTVILVIAGMILIGVFTATLTSILVGNESEAINTMKEDINIRMNKLDKKIDKLLKKE